MGQIQNLIDVSALITKPASSAMLKTFDEHLYAALQWIERASLAVNHKGISKGYDALRSRWFPAYPETTGYTLPTLINASRILGNDTWRNQAFNHAEFLLGCVNEEGGVRYWKESTNIEPIIFDTGQVIFGWLAVYKDSGEECFLQSAVNSGDYLVRSQDMDGVWRNHQHLGVHKVIDARVAWALLELYKVTKNEHYLHVAIRNLDWVISQQDDCGWFQNCAALPDEAPSTHNLAYTIEGLLRCGEIIGEPCYIQAGKKAADQLLRLQKPDGSIPGQLGSGWRKAKKYCCLTGNVQMAGIWYWCWDKFGSDEYRTSSQKALEFVCSTQNLSTKNKNIYGGIAGSNPIYGEYERFKYPEWAAKFFIDAILLYKAHDLGQSEDMLPG